MGDRVYIFIDGSNLDIATKQKFQKRVSPELLALKLVDGRRLMRVNYCDAPLLPDVNRQSFDGQQTFFQHLRRNPYFDLRLGRRVKRDKEFTCPHCNKSFTKSSFEQKGVDALIAFDLVALATRNAYDVAVIVSGDQDFVCPVLEVRMMGKYVENAFTEDVAWAPSLKNVVDKVIPLSDDFLKDCLH
jgi:uncharacterized LabA/DUF88 family protein